MQLDIDAVKRAELRRMKRLATGLLAGVACLYLITFLLEPRFPWLGFVRAFSEAAMIGALADWFAVTALFRHPLGIPIPHTAIIPRRKDTLGESVGRFVQENFLSPEVLVGRLRTMQVVDRVAQLATRDDVSQAAARQVTALISGALDVVNDDEIQQIVERSVSIQIRKLQPAPLLGRALGAVLRGERMHELVAEMMRLAAHLLNENRDVVRSRISRETPWWVPSAVDKAIADRIFVSVEATIQEISLDQNHPFYPRFEAVLATFIEQLKTDPATIERGEMLKQELLDSPVVRDFSVSLWQDLKGFLKDQSNRPDSALQTALQRSVRQFGVLLGTDEALAAKVQGWIEKIVVYLSREYRGQFVQLVSYTVERWDIASTVEKIELQVGRDLQFIRINGTIVGGLAGLVIYTLSLVLR